VNLTFRRLELQLTHKWAISRTSGTETSEVVVVELTDNDGLIGFGEAAPTARYDETAASVETFFKKVDPRRLSFTEVEASMKYLGTLSPQDMSAKCAFNIALLDGAAKRAKKPIYDFLGLGFRENHHVTSFTIGIDMPDVIRQKVLAAAR